MQKDNSPPASKHTELAGHTPVMQQYLRVTFFHR
jgi:hypothetical protein